MTAGRLLLLTGASGAGKSTLVSGVNARGLEHVTCHHLDDEPVPSIEEMIRDHGSPEAWQRARLDDAVAQIASATLAGALAVIESQFRPSDARASLARHGVTGRVILVECAYEARNARLTHDRGQPDLATADMDRWAAYLRGQADALDLRVLDTTHRSAAESIDALEAEIRAWQHA